MLEKPEVTREYCLLTGSCGQHCGHHGFALLVVGHPKLALRHYDYHHCGHRDCVPQVRVWFAGAFEIGVALSFTFFAAIAAGADIRAMISVAPLLIVLVLFYSAST